MRRAGDEQVRCGIVLAAGEGKRLEPLVRQLRDDALPKQYVTFIGRRSMLEHTFARVEKLIPRERIFTVIAEHHTDFPAVRRQISRCAEGTVIAQPGNKETAAGILLPLMHVVKTHPEASVAVFPSDHFIYEEDLFMSHVAIAFHAVERNPSLFVLMGVEPTEAEAEYGYIVPHGADGEKPSASTLQRVGRFVEKPDALTAREMMAGGALWNTMVMVFKVKSLLAIIEKINPELFAAFQEVLAAIGAPGEEHRIGEIYRRLKAENFSKGFLEQLPAHYPASLSVLSVRGVLWSDWGLPRSIERVLRKIDEQEAAEGRLWKLFNERLQLGQQRLAQTAEFTEARKRPARREDFKRDAGRPAITPPTR
ncbi:MAG TPA: sugar phosphate nucleotidyltransferase [Candidatus Binatia bacterium]|nr:sugar phosphate nucleotidyltransferase [Candidatus Binatia bacterium]